MTDNLIDQLVTAQTLVEQLRDELSTTQARALGYEGKIADLEHKLASQNAAFSDLIALTGEATAKLNSTFNSVQGLHSEMKSLTKKDLESRVTDLAVLTDPETTNAVLAPVEDATVTPDVSEPENSIGLLGPQETDVE